MRTIRPSRSLLLVFVIALVTACASGSTTLSKVDKGVDTSSGAGPEQGVVGAAPVALPTTGPATGDASGANGAVVARDDAKIIRTGTMDLEVKDVPTALRVARDGIVTLGGYVGASTTSNDGDRPSAQVTYRVPADRWEAALDLLRGLSGQTTKVVAEHTEAVEVTGQVVDLEARIRNFQASEIALQGIAEKATKVSDILEVQARLTDTRGQIEVLTGQLKDLNDRAGYATLTTNLNVPVAAVQTTAKNWEPTTVVDEASANLLSILQALGTAGIWFLIVWLPILLVAGALAAIVASIVRRTGMWRRPRNVAPPAATADPAAGEG